MIMKQKPEEVWGLSFLLPFSFLIWWTLSPIPTFHSLGPVFSFQFSLLLLILFLNTTFSSFSWGKKEQQCTKPSSSSSSSHFLSPLLFRPLFLFWVFQKCHFHTSFSSLFHVIFIILPFFFFQHHETRSVFSFFFFYSDCWFHCFASMRNRVEKDKRNGISLHLGNSLFICFPFVVFSINTCLFISLLLVLSLTGVCMYPFLYSGEKKMRHIGCRISRTCHFVHFCFWVLQFSHMKDGKRSTFLDGYLLILEMWFLLFYFSLLRLIVLITKNADN